MSRATCRVAKKGISGPTGRLLRSLLICLAITTARSGYAQQPADVTLLSLEQLLDINVVGASKYEQKQSEVAAAISVITRQEIIAFGWRTLDEALASLPGVHTTYDRQYVYLGTRGFGLPGDFNTRILLTIDGNRVNDAVFDQAYAGQDFPIDMTVVERIEFIPGPGGAVYGQNAMFGVVNVITRRGATVQGAEVATAAEFPQRGWVRNALWGGRLKNGVEVLGAASRLNAKGQDRLVDFGAQGSGLAAGLDGEADSQIFASVARGVWAVNVSYGDRRKDDPLATYMSDPLATGQNQRDRHFLGQAQFEQSFANGTRHVSARVFAGVERYTAPFTYGGVPTMQTGSSNWQGGEARVLNTAWTSHKILVGADYQANTRQDQSYVDFADAANTVDIPGSGWRAGVFAQDELALSSRATATIGLRADDNGSTGATWSPRAGLILRATPQTAFKVLYGRAHRAPNVFERDFHYQLQAANPDLRGETIDTFEVVTDRRVGTDLTLRGSLYQWTISHLITLDEDPVLAVVQYQSGAPVHARGMELSADKTWPSSARIRGSLSFQDVTHAGGAALLNSPGVLGKLNLSSPLLPIHLRLGYELRYDSARLSGDGSLLRGYTVSDVHLATTAVPHGAEVSLTIRNLFNDVFAVPGSRNNWQNAIEQDGRNVSVNVRCRF